MLLPQPMLSGVLVSRYKRFFADVALIAIALRPFLTSHSTVAGRGAVSRFND